MSGQPHRSAIGQAGQRGLRVLLIDHAERVAEAARSQGVAVVYRQAVSDKTIDFKPVLANIQAKHADAYTWGGLADTAAVLVKQAQESGMRQTAFMPDAVCTETFIHLSGKAGEGTICSTTTTATARARRRRRARGTRRVAARLGGEERVGEHRVGHLDIGGVALFVAVATSHRREGFEAASDLVERVKEELPIWKKQFFTDGSHEWSQCP